MKLNFFKRFVLFLYWLMSLAAGALAVMFCIWPDTVYMLFEKAYALITKARMDLIGMVLVCIYAILTVATVVIIFSGKNRKKDRGFITVDSSETGKTRIAVSAVEQMIRQAVRGIDGIYEMKSGITNYDDAISISSDVTLLDGVHVPTVTMNIQRSIRSYIELNCGVAVRGVSVSVKSVVNPEGKSKRSAKGRNFASASAKPEPAANDKPVYTEAPKPVEVMEPAYTEIPKPAETAVPVEADAVTADAEAPAYDENPAVDSIDAYITNEYDAADQNAPDYENE